MGDDHEARRDEGRTLDLPGLSRLRALAPASWSGRFDAGAMVPRLFSTDRMGAIKELVDRAHAAGWVADRLVFLQSVLGREDLESTVVTDGVAFPHARCRSVRRLGLAVGLSPEGVDFGPPQPVHFVCLFAVPAPEASSYLTLVAEASARFRSAPFRSGLLACPTQESMFQYLTRVFGNGRIPGNS